MKKIVSYFQIKKDLNVFFDILRILFGGIFVFSGIIKFFDLSQFEKAIDSFNIVSQSIIPFLAIFIPLIEISAGVLIILKLKPILNSQIIIYLLTFFTIIIFSKILEGEKLSCACFGNLSTSNIDRLTILRNIVLILIGFVIVIYYSLLDNSKSMSFKYILVEKQRIYKMFFSYLTIILFIILSSLIIIVAIQNKKLKERLYLLTKTESVLQEGDSTYTFTVETLDGKTTIIKFNNDVNKSLLYIYSTRCDACFYNFPTWVELTDTLSNLKIKPIGISIDDRDKTELFLSKFNPSFENFIKVDEIFIEKYKANLTPQTILIDKNGRVLKSWVGVLSGYDLYSLFKRIKN